MTAGFIMLILALVALLLSIVFLLIAASRLSKNLFLLSTKFSYLEKYLYLEENTSRADEK